MTPNILDWKSLSRNSTPQNGFQSDVCRLIYGFEHICKPDKWIKIVKTILPVLPRFPRILSYPTLSFQIADPFLPKMGINYYLFAFC
jgi:hypothetical protein